MSRTVIIGRKTECNELEERLEQSEAQLIVLWKICLNLLNMTAEPGVLKYQE